MDLSHSRVMIQQCCIINRLWLRSIYGKHVEMQERRGFTVSLMLSFPFSRVSRPPGRHEKHGIADGGHPETSSWPTWWWPEQKNVCWSVLLFCCFLLPASVWCIWHLGPSDLLEWTLKIFAAVSTALSNKSSGQGQNFPQTPQNVNMITWIYDIWYIIDRYYKQCCGQCHSFQFLAILEYPLEISGLYPFTSWFHHTFTVHGPENSDLLLLTWFVVIQTYTWRITNMFYHEAELAKPCQTHTLFLPEPWIQQKDVLAGHGLPSIASPQLYGW